MCCMNASKSNVWQIMKIKCYTKHFLLHKHTHTYPASFAWLLDRFPSFITFCGWMLGVEVLLSVQHICLRWLFFKISFIMLNSCMCRRKRGTNGGKKTEAKHRKTEQKIRKNWETEWVFFLHLSLVETQAKLIEREWTTQIVTILLTSTSTSTSTNHEHLYTQHFHCDKPLFRRM